MDFGSRCFSAAAILGFFDLSGACYAISLCWCRIRDCGIFNRIKNDCVACNYGNWGDLGESCFWAISSRASFLLGRRRKLFRYRVAFGLRLGIVRKLPFRATTYAARADCVCGLFNQCSSVCLEA